MADILDRHQPPEVAAESWLKANPTVVAGWLEGVTTFDGRPALSAMSGAGKLRVGFSLELWVSDHKIPVGDSVAVMIEYVKTHGRVLFDGVSAVIRGSVDGLTALLRAIPSPLLILGAAALSWVLRRSLPLAAFVVAALLFIMNQGYWEPTLETLSLVIVAALVSTAIGVPVGIAAAHRPRLYAALRPVLDLMQTLPTFVYLIPTLVLFGLGVVPGLISTVIFALPAPIRLTQLGVSSVPTALLEAGQAFGATPRQLLWKVELPSAAPTILAGITQCIMLSLSMVVTAALVGAGGLGVPVVRALSTVQVGMGFEAGEVSVLMGLSGSGKSTLLRSANGLNRVTRGQVLVRDGETIVDIGVNCDPATLRRIRRLRITMVFQQFGLLPWRTVRDNVGLGLELRGEPPDSRRRIIDQHLELVGLSQWGERYCSELSGGMQQRVGLARALATDADILLMDEPFSALDPLIRRKLQDELLALQERVKNTMLFVSHDLDEALKLGDKVTILEGGRIVQTGTGRDIGERPAEDYVAEFVRYVNPRTAIKGTAAPKT